MSFVSSPQQSRSLRSSESGGSSTPDQKSVSLNVQPVEPPRIFRKYAIIGAVVVGLLLGLCILAVSFFVWQRFSSSGPIANPITGAPIATPKPEEPSFTVALVGYGGAGHDGASLTDSILVARILLEQKRVVVVSVPRDLWVQVPTDSGVQPLKINAAYALHGPEALKTALSDVTGWQVDRFFGVDFRGFTEAIDTLGGVELTVERSFDDYEYPITGRERMVCEDELDDSGAVIATAEAAPDDGVTSVADEIAAGTLDRASLPENVETYPCRYEHLHFEAGRQTLTGVQALKYARSRHSAQDGNDFNRARRQQNLVQAVVTQVFRTNFLPKIPSLISTLRSHTATDLSALEIAEWLAKAPEVKEYPVTSLILTDKNYLSQGVSSDRQFVLQPTSGEFSWSHIQNWLRFVTVPDASLSFPVVEILAPPSQLADAQFNQVSLATQSALPIRVQSVSGARSASLSAQIIPLVPGIDPSVLEDLQRVYGGVIDASRISTASSALNGPHVRVVWEEN